MHRNDMTGDVLSWACAGRTAGAEYDIIIIIGVHMIETWVG